MFAKYERAIEFYFARLCVKFDCSAVYESRVEIILRYNETVV